MDYIARNHEQRIHRSEDNVRASESYEPIWRAMRVNMRAVRVTQLLKGNRFKVGA